MGSPCELLIEGEDERFARAAAAQALQEADRIDRKYSRYRDDSVVHAINTSGGLLGEAYGRVREAGFELVNADCVLIGEEPRIAPHREAMRDRLAATLGVDRGRVNIRATTTDGLGFTGRREGLAAQAVALLRSR